MLALIVMSKHQNILDDFFESLLPTINDKVVVYAVTKGLNVPEDPRIHSIFMSSFAPNKYFNEVKEKLDGSIKYIGIVNDDILFSKNWLEDVLELAKDHDYFSPGFIETEDMELFNYTVRATEEKDVVVPGVFDAFYVFSVEALAKVGDFDEEVVEWYDISLLLKMLKAGYKPVVSTKVTVMHLQALTLKDKVLYKGRVKKEILDKYGNWGLKRAKAIPLKARKEVRHV